MHIQGVPKVMDQTKEDDIFYQNTLLLTHSLLLPSDSVIKIILETIDVSFDSRFKNHSN